MLLKGPLVRIEAILSNRIWNLPAHSILSWKYGEDMRPRINRSICTCIYMYSAWMNDGSLLPTQHVHILLGNLWRSRCYHWIAFGIRVYKPFLLFSQTKLKGPGLQVNVWHRLFTSHLGNYRRHVPVASAVDLVFSGNRSSSYTPATLPPHSLFIISTHLRSSKTALFTGTSLDV